MVSHPIFKPRSDGGYREGSKVRILNTEQQKNGSYTKYKPSNPDDLPDTPFTAKEKGHSEGISIRQISDDA